MHHIEKRANLYYAVLTVPNDVRHLVGKLRYVQSTRTGNKPEAILRAANLVSVWKREIEAARGTLTDPRDTFWHDIRREHAKALQADEADEGEEGGTLAIEVQEVIRAAAGKITDPEEASFMYRTAIGRLPALPPLPPVPTPPETTSLAPLHTEWKKQLDLAPKTVDQMARDVGKLVHHFGDLQRLTPKGVKAWTDRLVTEGSTHASLKRILGSGRSFWKYLQSTSIIELDATDPFAGMIRLTSTKVERSRKKRKEFTPEEVASLYAMALGRADRPLADLIALGAYTGARIEELCSLMPEHASKGVLTIADAKTTAGIREVPLHPTIKALVSRLREAPSDGYLIESSAAGKYGVRSDPLSKRFGRMKAAMGFGPDHVFHSLRRTVVTLMERAGVPEGIAADIVGHEKDTVTYGLYGGGSASRQKLEAISKVAYPSPLDKP